MVGRMIEPLFAPLGFSWEVCVALICSFAAREVFVSALGTILNVSASAEGDAQNVAVLIRDQQILTFPAAVAALVFFVFACQCMSTLAVVRRETGTWRWPIVMFVYMTALAWGGAWIAAAAVVRLGS
jgi:ferrous iron transport protein B